MLDFQKINESIADTDEKSAREAAAHWDAISKPLHGLGHFEDAVVKIAGLTGTAQVHLDKKAVVVFCADNGVVAEGVTQTDASVTAVMAKEIADGRSSVCRMAAAAGASVTPYDCGMLREVPGVEGCHIADGTGNIAVGPAMSTEQACRAIQYGMALAGQYRERGYAILATGEMGIGNTTTSSALASVLLGLAPERVTGRGAGLSDEGLRRKVDVIARAIAVNQPRAQAPLEVLEKLGGFDIAAMTGLYLGGALHRIPIVIDGLISAVSAMIAARLCPKSVCAMIASHSSAEPAAQEILKELGLKAVIYADMKLGEGTGAVCMFPLLDMALSVYHSCATFADTGIGQYHELGGGQKC